MHVLLAEGAPPMTTAGKLITYVLFPLIVLAVAGGTAFCTRAIVTSKRRAVALAENAVRIDARMDTQDGALARLLEVINPIGQPNLTAVLARIQQDGEVQAKRLDDHILTAAADKEAFERRLEAVRQLGGHG